MPHPESKPIRSSELPAFLVLPAIITGALSLLLILLIFGSVYSAFTDEDVIMGSLVKIIGPLLIIVLTLFLISSIVVITKITRDYVKRIQK